MSKKRTAKQLCGGHFSCRVGPAQKTFTWMTITLKSLSCKSSNTFQIGNYFLSTRKRKQNNDMWDTSVAQLTLHRINSLGWPWKQNVCVLEEFRCLTDPKVSSLELCKIAQTSQHNNILQTNIVWDNIVAKLSPHRIYALGWQWAWNFWSLK